MSGAEPCPLIAPVPVAEPCMQNVTSSEPLRQRSIGCAESGPQTETKNIKIVILYLFAGKRRVTEDTFEHFVQQLGNLRGRSFEVVEFDYANGTEENLADDILWGSIVQRIRRRVFAGGLLSPPCGSFGCRRKDGRGPPPLRGCLGSERYGLPGLKPSDRDAVRMATLLAIRAAEAAEEFAKLRLPCVAEQPGQRDGRRHMFELDEWLAVIRQYEPVRLVVPQCNLGAEHVKMTCFLLFDITLPAVSGECGHAVKEWRDVPSGRKFQAAHAPLRGKIPAVLEKDWNENMRHSVAAANAPFLTASAATYPPGLNRWLAVGFVEAILGSDTEVCQNAAHGMVKVGRFGNTLVRRIECGESFLRST